MSIFFLAITSTACIFYFYSIGVWYLGLLPALFFLFLLGYYTSLVSSAMGYVRDREKYAIYAAWICILAGIAGVLHFLGMEFILILLRIVGINAVGRVASYIWEYEDGKRIFQIGYYVPLVVLALYIFFSQGLTSILNTITVLWSLHMGLIGFIVYVIGIWRKIEQYMVYTLAILVVGAICLIFLHSIDSMYIALLINSLFLTGVYHGISYVLMHTPHEHQPVSQISVRRILAGERVTKKKNQPVVMNDYVRYVYDFIHEMPLWTKRILEAMNTVIIVALIGVYMYAFSGEVLLWQHFIYWAIMAVFAYNVFVLQKLGYATLLQKIFLFVVMHFAVYVSLFYFLQGNWNDIARRGMVWNLTASAIIIYMPSEYLERILQVQDYAYWIFITLVVMCLNIGILSRGTLPGQLIFSFSFLYIGLQAMLLYYMIQRIKKYVLEE